MKNVEIQIEPIDDDDTFLIAVEDSKNSKALLNKHLSNLSEILLCSNATLIRGYQGIGYSCCFCLLQFIDPAELKLHNLEEHGDFSKCDYLRKKDIAKFNVKLDITGLECTVCKTDFDTLEQIIDHLANEHQRNIDLEVNNQILPFKFDTKPLRCCVCLNPFNKFKSLLEHMNVHYRNYVCPLCNAGYVNQSKLNSHSYIHKLGEFECEFCSKIFNTKIKKINHEKGVHTRINERAKCGYCSEKFKNKRKKEAHLAAVHGILTDRIKCQACDKTFPNADRMRIHTKRDHLMERTHQCPECDKKFFTPESLKDHLVKHSGLKEFQCNVCFKAYARKKTLTEHLRIHADDRRFKCEHCGHAFIQKCSWKTHMRRKHGSIFN